MKKRRLSNGDVLPAMCYTIADTITVPQGMFYVLDRATGMRYKAAPTKDEAMENWKAGWLQQKYLGIWGLFR